MNPNRSTSALSTSSQSSKPPASSYSFLADLPRCGDKLSNGGVPVVRPGDVRGPFPVEGKGEPDGLGCLGGSIMSVWEKLKRAGSITRTRKSYGAFSSAFDGASTAAAVLPTIVEARPPSLQLTLSVES